jgi:peroxiredoxin
MKYSKMIILVTIFTAIILSANTQTVKQVTFKGPSEKEKLELTGTIPGLRDGETVILKRLEIGGRPDLIDSAKVTDGKFYFQYHIDNAPQYFTITFSKHLPFIALPLINEKTFLTSKTSLDDMQQTNFVDYITVDGSKTFEDWIYIGLGVGRTWYQTNQFINGTINKYKDSTLSKERLQYIAGLLKAKQALAVSASIALDYEPNRDIVPLFYRNQSSEIQHSSVWPDIFTKLSEDARKSFYGKLMSDCMPICEGQPAPNFTFVSNDNNSMSLNDIVKKNKLTILHFWSNGSVERARIHNELQTAYKKYKVIGLEVVSISLDANPEKWKKAIKEDKIPGIQSCDFKEDESPIAILYKMDPRNTVNVLINENGKIIAWDVDGPAFFGHLYTLFGE